MAKDVPKIRRIHVVASGKIPSFARFYQFRGHNTLNLLNFGLRVERIYLVELNIYEKICRNGIFTGRHPGTIPKNGSVLGIPAARKQNTGKIARELSVSKE